MKPRLLDLFSGAGGAAVGYHRAGFEVVGVDHVDQPQYPFRFIQADALTLLRRWTDGKPCRGVRPLRLAAIHASPPCQRYTTMGQRFAETQAQQPDLIAEVRERLEATNLPYVIENVMGARRELRSPVRLCGSSFGLGVHRHRLFETNWPLLIPQCAHGDSAGAAVYGKLDGRRLRTRADGSELRAVSTLAEGQAAMGIDWMEWPELTQAIPPAYTELIGHQLLTFIHNREREVA